MLVSVSFEATSLKRHGFFAGRKHSNTCLALGMLWKSCGFCHYFWPTSNSMPFMASQVDISSKRSGVAPKWLLNKQAWTNASAVFWGSFAKAGYCSNAQVGDWRSNWVRIWQNGQNHLQLLTPLALRSDVERYSEKHILLHCPLFQQSSRQEDAIRLSRTSPGTNFLMDFRWWFQEVPGPDFWAHGGRSDGQSEAFRLYLNDLLLGFFMQLVYVSALVQHSKNIRETPITLFQDRLFMEGEDPAVVWCHVGDQDLKLEGSLQARGERWYDVHLGAGVGHWRNQQFSLRHFCFSWPPGSPRCSGVERGMEGTFELAIHNSRCASNWGGVFTR